MSLRVNPALGHASLLKLAASSSTWSCEARSESQSAATLSTACADYTFPGLGAARLGAEQLEHLADRVPALEGLLSLGRAVPRGRPLLNLPDSATSSCFSDEGSGDVTQNPAVS